MKCFNVVGPGTSVPGGFGECVWIRSGAVVFFRDFGVQTGMTGLETLETGLQAHGASCSRVARLALRHQSVTPMRLRIPRQSDSGMLTDRDSLLRKLHELRSEHRDLDTVIARVVDTGPLDQLHVVRLKKRKLLLKDEIAWLDEGLAPLILRISQDRVAEKSFLNGAGVPTAPWRAVGSLAELEAAVAALGHWRFWWRSGWSWWGFWRLRCS
eukprot:gene1970-2006_t